jgi:methylenetetrahydrofolate reductase (NADPH)
MPTSELTPLSESPAGTVACIAAFMRGFSIEATRPPADELAALRTVLPPETPVYLTAIPKLTAAELIVAAAGLRKLNLEPVPHLAARSFASRHALGELLSALAGQTRIRRALVIAGDRERAAGPFESALDIIESGLLQEHGIVEIGIAGYPEGHPRLSAEVLDRLLKAKIEAAEQTGLRVHIVTQFAFAPTTILNWLRRLRALGLEQPVRIGMAGPTGVARLLRYAQRCGVRASAQGLAQRAGLVKHLLGVNAPDRIVRPLAEACTKNRLGPVAAHFFSFGGAPATARWTAATAAGHIVRDRAEGFAVEPS